MQNYKIIIDENILKKFINEILPDNEDNEQFYLCLLARNKWNKQIQLKEKQIQLKRFTSTKERIIEKLRQLECVIGSYKSHDIDIPNELLGVYIMPNPRDLKKAQLNLLKEIANNVINNNFNDNPQSIALNEIQKSCSRKLYYDIDIDIDKIIIDDKSIILQEILKIIKQNFSFDNEMNNKDIIIIDTHGGYHILLNVNKGHKNWYQSIKNIKFNGLISIQMNGDNLVPLPGCVQGNRTPFIINF